MSIGPSTSVSKPATTELHLDICKGFIPLFLSFDKAADEGKWFHYRVETFLGLSKFYLT
jgi:hypothetical protein